MKQLPYQKRTIFLLVGLLLAVATVLSSCSLVVAGEADVAVNEREVGENIIILPQTAEAYIPQSTAENGTAATDALLADFGTYHGEEILFATANETLFLPENTETVLDKLTAQRNRYVEEKLSVKLVTETRTADEILAYAKAELAAGERGYDILALPAHKLATLYFVGGLTDLTKVDTYRSSASYAGLLRETNTALSHYAVGGASSAAPGDYIAVYANKTVLTEAGVETETLYDAVEAGTWTWEKMLALQESVTTAELATPFAESSLTDTVFRSGGGTYLTSDKNGLVLALATAKETVDKTFSAVTALEESGIKTSSYTAADDFAAGKTSFLLHKLSAMEKISSSGALFAVLPLPTLTEGSAYVTPLSKEITLLGVSKNAAEPTCATEVLYALNAASDGIVNGGYAEYALSSFLCDERSADMLDLILHAGSYDLAFSWGEAVPTVADGTTSLLAKLKGLDEKTYSKTVGAVQKKVAKAVETAKKNAKK